MGDCDRMLLTRPQAQSERFAAAARAALGEALAVVIAPLQAIVPLEPLPAMDGVAGLILSSENGAAGYAALGGLPGLVAWCVGARTAAAARAAGLRPVLAGPDADGLVAHLGAVRPPGRLLHLHGRHTAGAVAARLTALGLPVAAAAVYDQVAQPLPAQGQAALARPGPILVPVFSPRSAALLRPWLEAAAAAPRLAAISPAAAAALQPLPGWPVEIAATPDADAVLAALSRLRDR